MYYYIQGMRLQFPAPRKKLLGMYLYIHMYPNEGRDETVEKLMVSCASLIGKYFVVGVCSCLVRLQELAEECSFFDKHSLMRRRGN